MAFIQKQFVVLSGQGKRGEAFQTCGYLTQDSKEDIFSEGYFNELSGKLSANDVIYIFNNTEGARNSYTAVVESVDIYGLVTVIESSSVVTSVNGRSGDVVLDKTDVGLDNVDNTPDLDKPISTATQDALDLKANITYVDTGLSGKVDKVAGYGLSQNDFTDAYKANVDANNQKPVEAPIDGEHYSRKDGSWVNAIKDLHVQSIDDEQFSISPNEFGWKGTIISDTGKKLSSSTMISSAVTPTYGTPTYNRTTKIWTAQTGTDFVAINLNKNDIPTTTYSKFEVYTRVVFGTVGGTFNSVLSQGTPDCDVETFLLRRLTSSGNMQVYISSTGSSWDVVSTYTFTGHVFDNTTEYDFRYYHEQGIVGKFEWSEDGKDYDDPTKTWNIIYTTVQVPRVYNYNIENVCTFMFGGDAYTSNTIPTSIEQVFAEHTGIRYDDVEYKGTQLESGVLSTHLDTYHQFVGKNSSDELILEFCKQKDGSDLQFITGDKQHIFSNKVKNYGMFMHEFTGYSDVTLGRFYTVRYINDIVRTSTATSDTRYNSLIPSNSSGIKLRGIVRGASSVINQVHPTNGNIYSLNQLYSSLNSSQTTSYTFTPLPYESDEFSLYIQQFNSYDQVWQVDGYSINRGGLLNV